MIFCWTFFWNISRTKKCSVRCHKYALVYINYNLFLSDSNNLSVSWRGFRNILRHKISWESFIWEPNFSVRTKGRTETHDEAISCFFAFFRKPLTILVCKETNHNNQKVSDVFWYSIDIISEITWRNPEIMITVCLVYCRLLLFLLCLCNMG